MSTEMSFQVRDDYLLVVARGEHPTAANIDPLFKSVQDRSREANRSRILVDARSVSKPAAEFDRYLMGKAAAEMLGPPIRTAVVCRAEYINKFAENTGINRGALLLICDDEKTALQWLLGAVPGGEPL